MLRDLQFEPMAGPKRVFIIHDAEGLEAGRCGRREQPFEDAGRAASLMQISS